VAVCVVVTADTVAANPALVAPAETSTEAGTTTAVLLLLNPTVVPPVGAAPLSETVHASVPAPLIEPFAHVTALSTGVAAGARVIEYVAVAPPPCAVRVAVCDVVTDDTVAANPALVAPAGTSTEAGTATAVLLLLSPTDNPPLGAAPLNDTVHASVPAPVIEPFAQLIPLSAAVAGGSRLIAYVAITPPACAVSVAVCDVVTDDTVAANPALVAPAGTSTEAGTARAALLLLSATVRPPDGAAAVSETVQRSLPVPLIDPLAQFSPASAPDA